MARQGERGLGKNVTTIDREAPASIVVGLFGGLTAFCKLSGYATSTVHAWVVKGLIPSPEFARIQQLATDHKVPLDPADFVPPPAAG